MEVKIELLAGTPNDDNREYLPEAIKDSDMMVNENGNNSQVYPKRLIEYKESLINDQTNVWYEYVPESYNPEIKTPLVFSMHGGLMTGWGQAIYTSWTLVADREGFIVVFPNALLRRFWMIECEKEKYEELSAPNPSGVYMNPYPEDVHENHDINVVLELIKKMKEKYNIDESRIYMQGMSLGNNMTAMIARYYGNLFAGMAGSAGPSCPGLLFNKEGRPNNIAGPVAIWQSRAENDNPPPGCEFSYEDTVVKNREYWCMINQCDELPEIKIDGENNLAFYKGKEADYVFRDIKNRDHGQTFDDAEIVWDCLFSGVSRNENGDIENQVPLVARKGDEKSFAVASDCDYAWVNNKKVFMHGTSFMWNKLKYHGLNGDQIVRGSYIMVPAAFLAETFGLSYESLDNGGKVEITMQDGRKLQFARGCIGCTIDNRIHSMLCEAVQRGDTLCISAEWFCKEVCQLHTSTYNQVMYSTNHYSLLSLNMARLIKDILQGK